MCEHMRHLIDVERLVSGFMTLFYGAKLVSDTLRLRLMESKWEKKDGRAKGGRGGGGRGGSRTEGDREVLHKEAEKKDEKNCKSKVHLVLKILML